MAFFLTFVGVMILLSGFVIPHRWAQLYRWLKGSRRTYYIGQDGLVTCFHKKLRTPVDRVGIDMNPNNQGVIEINHGQFRHSSAIYGGCHIGPWKISKYWRWESWDGDDCLSLTDGHGLRADIALQMINAYPSLQAMLDRIAEQDMDLQISLLSRREYRSAIVAILKIIDDDKQKYRSRAAGNIRACLEDLIGMARFQGEPEITDTLVLKWLNEFKEVIVKDVKD